jgi:hypothetical protein
MTTVMSAASAAFGDGVTLHAEPHERKESGRRRANKARMDAMQSGLKDG